MRLSSVKDIKEGMVVGKSLYYEDGKLLLGAGFRISSEIIARLFDRGYTHVYIMEEGTEDIIPEDVISDEIRQQAKSKLFDKVSELEGAEEFKELTYEKAQQLLETGYLQQFNIAFDLRQTVKEILNEISVTGSTFMKTLMLKSKDSYFFDHAVNTTVLSILIGAKYRFSKKELMCLALGTFLHDIGKVVINQIKDKSIPDPGSVYYREHPTFGYLLLQNSPGLSSMEIQIVNQHHEFQDGSGFPIGLKGNNLPPTQASNPHNREYIFRLAEITCVVNEFDNLLVNPMQKMSMTPDEALKILISDAVTKYNRHVVEMLNKVVPIFPIGTRVEIVDIIDPNLLGCFGFVARITEKRLDRPVIIITTDKHGHKIKPIMLDTSKLTRIELKLVF